MAPPKKNNNPKNTEQSLNRPCNMIETNNGGRLESVPGFDAERALTVGFRGGRVPRQLRSTMVFDAGDLQFAAPQSACGIDDRVLVPNTTALPWRCVCQLVVDGLHNARILGTGWLAGPHTIVTAGHNLLDVDSGQQAVQVWITPGRTGDTAPYGYEVSKSFAVHPRWKANKDREYDIGVIYTQNPFGQRLGWFGFAALSDVELANLLVNNAGYPVDKQFGTMWFNASRLTAVKPHVLAYGLDTEGGQSGSPIFAFDKDGNRTVVAVHAYGTCPDNMGIRITPEIFRDLSAMIK